MSQSVFGRQQKLRVSYQVDYTRNTDVALTSAAKESTNDVPEVVSVKNLPENGALWCRNVTVESASHPGREDGLRCSGEPRQLTSSTTEMAPSSKKDGRFTQFQQRQKVLIYRRDLLQQPESSFGSSRASR